LIDSFGSLCLIDLRQHQTQKGERQMLTKKIMIMGGVLTSLLLMGGCSTSDEALAKDEVEVSLIDEIPHEEETYYFPHENDEHEGTWLQWPHNKTYEGTVDAYEHIWIEMTRGLVKGENVHIVAYDEKEKERIKKVLISEKIDMTRVDFLVSPTDDVWSRDNGPIFAYDNEGNLVVQNWQFNGWGNKAPYEKDNAIPKKVGEALGLPVIDIDMVMEGGALELDGKGTLISTLSCVNNDNRTADYTLDEIEDYLRKYYGVSNFIWLEGVAGMDITDNHIDGMIKIYDEHLIIASSEFDLDPDSLEDGDDAKTLLTAKNAMGEPYDFVFMPETKKKVVKVDGEWIKGAYLNFYVANAVVLVPNYNDENDAVANQILQNIYKDKEVIGIDVRDLYADGGMIHCVTQQQPVHKALLNQ